MKDKDKDFESRLNKLESLAERIKDNDIPLEEALKVFEEGIKLSKTLKKDLDSMQSRVSILLDEEDEARGAPLLEDFESGHGGDGARDKGQ